MKKKLSFALCALFLFCSISLNAVDFGLVFSQNAQIDVPDFNFGDTVYDISGVLVPRITALIGDTGDLYVSAAVKYEVASGSTDSLKIIPELTRTDYTFAAGGADVRIGRMFYSDSLGLVANNLFDGAQVSFFTSNWNFRAGAWYTGLLYKKSAKITVMESELLASDIEVDFNNFAGTYFAPSYILAAFDYSNSSLAEFIGLNVSLLTQYGLGNDKIDAYYLTASLSIPVSSYIFDIGGCFELIDYKGGMTPAFAGGIGLTLILPTELEKHLKISGLYSSGVSESNTFGAFLPLTTVPQGEILEAKLSGLSLLCAQFTGRLAKSLSTNLAFTYFIRSDLGTYRSYPVTSGSSHGYILGGEIFGRLIWNISTGARLNLGTGVFLPSLGNANPDEKSLWRTNLNLVISIY